MWNDLTKEQKNERTRKRLRVKVDESNYFFYPETVQTDSFGSLGGYISIISVKSMTKWLISMVAPSKKKIFQQRHVCIRQIGLYDIWWRTVLVHYGLKDMMMIT